MPRSARRLPGGYCYHVLNRGNGRRTVFHKDGDYNGFLNLVADACERLPLRILAYCLMPNHFHLVAWPAGDRDLSEWMQWLTTTHVRRYHRHYVTSGHVWQGRFKAFPIEHDDHLLTVLRYVERNPVRAALVRRAEDWSWSSARWRAPKRGLAPAAPAHPQHHAQPNELDTSPAFDNSAAGACPLFGAAVDQAASESRPDFLVEGPVPRGSDWLTWVNAPMTEAEVRAVRKSVERGRPFGSPAWTRRTAADLGLESTLRERGRPKKGTGSGP